MPAQQNPAFSSCTPHTFQNVGFDYLFWKSPRTNFQEFLEHDFGHRIFIIEILEKDF